MSILLLLLSLAVVCGIVHRLIFDFMFETIVSIVPTTYRYTIRLRWRSKYSSKTRKFVSFMRLRVYTNLGCMCLILKLFMQCFACGVWFTSMALLDDLCYIYHLLQLTDTKSLVFFCDHYGQYGIPCHNQHEGFKIESPGETMRKLGMSHRPISCVCVCVCV
jgi:hypothetical protein